MDTVTHITPALALVNVTKSFGSVSAVRGLDLAIAPGEFYALLGPNGAGKTTTLRMVAGLLKPDAGRVEIDGIDVIAEPAAAKRGLAWLPDEPLLYDKLTGFEYLEFVAGLWSLARPAAESRAQRLFELLELWDQRHVRTENYSKGMRQKLALAGALIHDPKLLVLDEPLTGLDAVAARQVKNLLKDIVTKGATVVMTTHILEVAERLAERIGIIHAGELIAEGTLEELRAAHGHSGTTLEDLFLTLTAREMV